MQTSNGTTVLGSSTKASKFVIPPSLPSKSRFVCLHFAALALSLTSSFDMIMYSTSAARIGLKGHH